VEAVSILTALHEMFIRLYNAGDFDALVETCYTEDAYLLPPNHPRVYGRAQICRFLQGLREGGRGELSAETIQLDASGGLAYCMGVYVFGLSAGTRGTFLEVYRRQADGSWKMVMDMFNGDEAAS
jgi:ketosteroid isomerase-like protein